MEQAFRPAYNSCGEWTSATVSQPWTRAGSGVQKSREAAQEYSPRRKPWVNGGPRASPGGAKKRCDAASSAPGHLRAEKDSWCRRFYRQLPISAVELCDALVFV